MRRRAPERPDAAAWLAALAGLLAAAAWFQPAVAGGDLWWHLAAGREIVSRGAVPVTDAWSFTAAGRPWLNHEWGWDVLAWLVWSVSPQLLAWLNLALLVVVFGLFQLVAWRASGSLAGSALAVWAAAATAHWFLDIRPHLVGLVFTAVLLATARWRRAPWLWPPLIVVWCNIHGSFVFGLGLVGLVALARTVERSIEHRRFAPRAGEWLAAGACFLAMLVNPWGLELLEFPLSYLDRESAFRTLAEWRPPERTLDPRLYAGRFALLALVSLPGWLLAWRSRSARLAAALALVTFAMALSARKFILLFSLTAMPSLAVGLAWLERSLLARAPRSRLLVRSSVALALALAAFAGWREVRLAPDLLYRWTEGHTFPRAATRYLEAAAPSRLHVFADFRWGGWLALELPRSRTFIDGRANTVFDATIYADYATIHQGEPGFSLLLARYDPDVVLLPPEAPLVRELLRGRGRWRAVYADPVAVVLVPPDREPEVWPEPEAVVGDAAGLLLARAARARRAGDLDEAERLAERAADVEPLFLPAYAELMAIHAARGDAAGIGRTLDTARRRAPRQAAEIEAWAALAYRGAGDLERARLAHRRSRHTGPF